MSNHSNHICKLKACCGKIIKLNATGSGTAGLDVVGLSEAAIASLNPHFRLQLSDAESNNS